MSSVESLCRRHRLARRNSPYVPEKPFSLWLIVLVNTILEAWIKRKRMGRILYLLWWLTLSLSLLWASCVLGTIASNSYYCWVLIALSLLYSCISLDISSEVGLIGLECPLSSIWVYTWRVETQSRPCVPCTQKGNTFSGAGPPDLRAGKGGPL